MHPGRLIIKTYVCVWVRYGVPRRLIIQKASALRCVFCGPPSSASGGNPTSALFPIGLIDSVIKLKINTNVGINFIKCTQFAFGNGQKTFISGNGCPWVKLHC